MASSSSSTTLTQTWDSKVWMGKQCARCADKGYQCAPTANVNKVGLCFICVNSKRISVQDACDSRWHVKDNAAAGASEDGDVKHRLLGDDAAQQDAIRQSTQIRAEPARRHWSLRQSSPELPAQPSNGAEVRNLTMSTTRQPVRRVLEHGDYGTQDASKRRRVDAPAVIRGTQDEVVFRDMLDNADLSAGYRRAEKQAYKDIASILTSIRDGGELRRRADYARFFEICDAIDTAFAPCRT